MGNKIFVGGLNWRTTEPDLKAAFSRYADVASVRIIIDRETGRSKCFGFLEFADPNSVPEVIEKCDGMKLDGRHIKVSAARERPAPAPAPSKPAEGLDNEVDDGGSAANSVDSASPEVNESSSEISTPSKDNGETSAHA